MSFKIKCPFLFTYFVQWISPKSVTYTPERLIVQNNTVARFSVTALLRLSYHLLQVLKTVQAVDTTDV